MLSVASSGALGRDRGHARGVVVPGTTRRLGAGVGVGAGRGARHARRRRLRHRLDHAGRRRRPERNHRVSLLERLPPHRFSRRLHRDEDALGARFRVAQARRHLSRRRSRPVRVPTPRHRFSSSTVRRARFRQVRHLVRALDRAFRRARDSPRLRPARRRRPAARVSRAHALGPH